MKKYGGLLLVLSLLFACFAGCKADGPAENTSTLPSGQGLTTQAPAVTWQTQNVSQTPAGTEASQIGTTKKQEVQVTLQEGWSFMQVAQALESAGVCTAASFYETAQSYTVKSFSIPSSSNRCFKMEGYLFPDTYTFYAGDNPADVLRKMLNNYAAKSGMPSDETLILASIIEKEARSDENMRLVSSVYHNRLKVGMKLQADPTREYVNEFITGNTLVAEPAKYAALYNTEKCPALPAGPVCNPSARAIQAAMNYPETEYLFFFFGQDNQNHYSKTDAEHEQQKAQYGVG